jgi:hypothetical protein
MLRRKALIVATGAALAVAALAAAPAADAHGGNVGFSFSIAGPGYAVGVGNAPYYAPTYVAPPAYYAPPSYYAPPAYSYYAPPVYAAPVVVAAPYRYYYRRPYGHVYYHHH